MQNKTEGCLYANQKSTVGRLTSISKCFHPRHKPTCSAIQSLNEVRPVLWLAHLNIKGHGTEPRADVCPHNVTSVKERHNLQQGLLFISDLSNFVSFSTDGPILLWVLILHSPVVTIRTSNLTFINSTFCPRSVFMCFVWIWEQTAIISLYSINWLVCITETECVYCAVRAGSLYIYI